MPLIPAKKQKTPACIREIQVHKLWPMVYSQQGSTAMHSWQPLLGVNLSPEFVNLYFPYAGRFVVVVVFAGGSGILNSNQHVWQWKEEAVLCETHMHNFKSHFQ